MDTCGLRGRERGGRLRGTGVAALAGAIGLLLGKSAAVARAQNLDLPPVKGVIEAEARRGGDATPLPPRYVAHVLDRLELPPGFNSERWSPWCIADDGTIYGYLDGNGKYRAFVSSVEGGTQWLLPNYHNDREEIRPLAASVQGVVLLFRWTWPSDGVLLPDGRIFALNGLHPNIFFPDDLNNRHVLVGQIGVQPDNSAVIYDRRDGFTILAEPESHALVLNDLGSVAGHVGGTLGSIAIRVWHADGRISDFDLPRYSTTPISLVGMNNADEVVGTHTHDDGTGDIRRGGWYWSEATGLMEIPFLHYREGVGGDVLIYGISDAGWVLGNEPYYDGENTVGHYFLWRPDAGFFDLGDMYEWEGVFYVHAARFGNAAVNAVGQIVIENDLIHDETGVRCVLLDPLPPR